MSYLVVSTEKENYVQYSERKVPYFSTFYNNDFELQIFCGELHKVEQLLINECWESDENKLAIDEAFSLVKINKNENKIYFATSKCGQQPIFYYCEDKTFLLSDDFWEIVNYLKPGENDINDEAVIENLNLPYPLFFTTFIKNVNYLPPGYTGEFDIKRSSLNLKKYFDFRYTIKADINLEKATKNVDKIINKLMTDIKEECGDVEYSVGLSGGLDSRVIPYYAKRNGLKISSFIFGASKPHNLFLSRDHKNARTLAKLFNIRHKEIEWEKRTLKERINIEMKNCPIGSPQFFKFEIYNDYDVLLTGGSGIIVGSMLISNDFELVSKKEVVNYIWDCCRTFYPNTRLNRRIEQACKYLFGKPLKFTHNEDWYRLIYNKEIQEKICNKLYDFVISRRREGKTNFDIYEEYLNLILGARNRFGGFESGLGTKRSFSIYAPRMLGETLQWPLYLLHGRPVLKNLIKKYIPAAAKIKQQNYEGNLISKSNLIVKIFNMFIFIIRGNGTAMEQKYFKYCIEEFKSTMLNECEWFYNIVDLRKYINKIIKFDDFRFILTLWKTKMIIDIIESKQYTMFIRDKEKINF